MLSFTTFRTAVSGGIAVTALAGAMAVASSAWAEGPIEMEDLCVDSDDTTSYTTDGCSAACAEAKQEVEAECAERAGEAKPPNRKYDGQCCDLKTADTCGQTEIIGSGSGSGSGIGGGGSGKLIVYSCRVDFKYHLEPAL